MKTKLFTLLLAVAPSVGTMFAEKVQIGDLYYNLDATNKTAEVTYKSNDNYGYNAGWGITTANIPSSVEYNSVTYSVTSIGDWAFFDCIGLTSVTIPNSVTSIGVWAFNGCTGLTSPLYNAHVFAYMPTSYTGAYTIPDGIETIAGGAFSGCTGLTSITIPNSVTSIGDNAFGACTGLASPLYNAHVFAYMPTSYTGAYTIPDGIEIIAGGAFSGCSGLTSVTIPNSVTIIGDYAFSHCSGLTSVTIEAETPPTLVNNAFYGTNNCPIYVPCGTLDAYKNTARWSDYASRIQYVPLVFVVTGLVTETMMGRVVVPTTLCDDTLITAVPNYGYHFVRWNDGNIDNPRTITLASDTTFTAEFAHNPIITYVYNSQMGTVSGPTITTTGVAVEYITFNATPNYGYHFT